MGKIVKCPNCLEAFVRKSKEQVFCSHRCQDAYKHRAKRRLEHTRSSEEYKRLWQQFNKYHKPINGYPEVECPGCGVHFIPKTSVQIYCCKACGDKVRRKDPIRQRAYKKNQARYSSSSVEHFMRRLLNKKDRNRHLTLECVMNLYHEQHGKCALSGIPMTHIAGRGRVATNISIDRIDSSRGYEERNIQLVCCAVNIAKSNWPQEVFIELCQQVATHSRQPRENSNPLNDSSSNLRKMSKSANAGRHEDSRKKGSKRNKKSWGKD